MVSAVGFEPTRLTVLKTVGIPLAEADKSNLPYNIQYK